MKKYIIIIVIIPTFAYANIGEDLNNLFHNFFNNDDSPVDPTSGTSSNIKTNNISDNLDIPEINLSDNPSEEDLTEIKKEIFLEEQSLEDFNERILAEESSLWKVGNKKNSIKIQLTQLDNQIGINTNKLNFYKKLEKKWKNLLENITRKKSIIKTELRIRQREYERFMTKNFIRNEYFGSNNSDISLIKWLFSQKTVSEILEEKSEIRNKKNKQKSILKNLKILNTKLKKEEMQASFLYGKISKLHQDIAKEKINLKDFAESKSRLLTNLEQSESILNNNLKNYNRQKNEAAIYLQNLHQTLKTTAEKLGQKYENPTKEIKKDKIESFFSSPLKIPLKITAFFHDPEYKKNLGREHNAVDFFAPQGSDLVAPADGIVEKIGLNNYGYSYLIIKHDEGFYTVYGHLSEIKVNKGQVVKKGEIIGLTGGTPGTKGAGYFTTGPHLHFEVFRNNHFVDPLKFLPKIQ